MRQLCCLWLVLAKGLWFLARPTHSNQLSGVVSSRANEAICTSRRELRLQIPTVQSTRDRVLGSDSFVLPFRTPSESKTCLKVSLTSSEGDLFPKDAKARFVVYKEIPMISDRSSSKWRECTAAVLVGRVTSGPGTVTVAPYSSSNACSMIYGGEILRGHADNTTRLVIANLTLPMLESTAGVSSSLSEFMVQLYNTQEDTTVSKVTVTVSLEHSSSSAGRTGGLSVQHPVMSPSVKRDGRGTDLGEGNSNNKFEVESIKEEDEDEVLSQPHSTTAKEDMRNHQLRLGSTASRRVVHDVSSEDDFDSESNYNWKSSNRKLLPVGGSGDTQIRNGVCTKMQSSDFSVSSVISNEVEGIKYLKLPSEGVDFSEETVGTMFDVATPHKSFPVSANSALLLRLDLPPIERISSEPNKHIIGLFGVRSSDIVLYFARTRKTSKLAFWDLARLPSKFAASADDGGDATLVAIGEVFRTILSRSAADDSSVSSSSVPKAKSLKSVLLVMPSLDIQTSNKSVIPVHYIVQDTRFIETIFGKDLVHSVSDSMMHHSRLISSKTSALISIAILVLTVIGSVVGVATAVVLHVKGTFFSVSKVKSHEDQTGLLSRRSRKGPVSPEDDVSKRQQPPHTTQKNSSPSSARQSPVPRNTSKGMDHPLKPHSPNFGFDTDDDSGTIDSDSSMSGHRLQSMSPLSAGGGYSPLMASYFGEGGVSPHNKAPALEKGNASPGHSVLKSGSIGDSLSSWFSGVMPNLQNILGNISAAGAAMDSSYFHSSSLEYSPLSTSGGAQPNTHVSLRRNDDKLMKVGSSPLRKKVSFKDRTQHILYSEDGRLVSAQPTIVEYEDEYQSDSQAHPSSHEPTVVICRSVNTSTTTN